VDDGLQAVLAQHQGLSWPSCLILGMGMVVAGAIVGSRLNLSTTVLVVLVGCGFAAAVIAKLLSAGQERRPWLERSLGITLLLLGVGRSAVMITARATSPRCRGSVPCALM
jgi:uncharacterized membrane protein HdeD (DUF308 family)